MTLNVIVDTGFCAHKLYAVHCVTCWLLLAVAFRRDVV